MLFRSIISILLRIFVARYLIIIFIMTPGELYDYGETALLASVPKAREIKKNMICPVHRRKILFDYDYTDAGTNVYITRYCCLEHAQRVAQAFKDAELFDNIHIENQQ